MEHGTKLILKIENESILNDFVTMIIVGKQVDACHIEDRDIYSWMFDELKEKVLSHYIQVCDDFDMHPFERVLLNTYNEVWPDEEMFTEMYQLWVKNQHSVTDKFLMDLP